ncbi:hypothetical protein FJZ36_08800 [Candidatus Poribacteria bacterium]|nr:hypothetical protein [Candidatus Poribacteria bacterium]
MMLRKQSGADGFDSGTHRVRLVAVEEVEHDFNDGKGLQTRAIWTFEGADDPSRQVRGFSGIRLTANSRLAAFVTAIVGVGFDRLPDALDVERLVGRTAIAQVETTPEGRARIVALVADVAKATAPKPRSLSPDREDAIARSERAGSSEHDDLEVGEDDIPF